MRGISGLSGRRRRVVVRWGRWLTASKCGGLLGDLLRRIACARIGACRDDPGAVRYLAAALLLSSKKIAEKAQKALSSLKSAAATDELIDLILEDPARVDLIPFVDGNKYRHSDEGRWYLYLVIARRFDDLVLEDDELRRLRKEFWALSGSLRARVRESVLASGDLRLNPLFVREKGDKPEADLTNRDAEILMRINIRNRNWEGLFGFFWVLPARHIAASLRAMKEAGWSPAVPDEARLLSRLMAVTGSVYFDETKPHIAVNPVFDSWIGLGESSEFLKKGEAELRSMLSDEVSPPWQVAAMAALKKTDRLTEEDVARTARSPHWLVRLACASLGEYGDPEAAVTGSGPFWFDRIMPALDERALWEVKPGRITRDGLERLRREIDALPDPGLVGGLALAEAVASHYTAEDIEIDGAGPVPIEEDSFEVDAGPFVTEG